MKASEIIAALGAYEDDKRRTGYRALCPAHEKDGSHSPSLILDFNRETKKALLHCESRKCDLDDILVGAGLSRRDLADVQYIDQSIRSMTGAATKTPATDDARRNIAGTVYRYAVNLEREVTDNPGGEIAEMLRKGYGIDPTTLTVAGADELGVGLDDRGWLTATARTAEGGVAFVQYRNPAPDASPRWLTERNPDDRTRWDAAGFVGRRHPEATVLVCEGSSDALALAALDRYDVVAVRGASLGGRITEVASELVGRDVVIVVDNDEAGRTMTRRMLDILAPMTSSVAYARFPEGFDVRDVRDIDPDTFAERLEQYIAEAKRYEAKVDFDFTPYLAGTDADRAEAFIAYARALGLDVAHTESHGWLVYDGTVWHPRADALARQICVRLGKQVRETAREEQAKIDADPDAFSKRDRERVRVIASLARGFLNSTTTKALLDVARGLPGVAAKADDFDANPDVLGVGNGVVDLRTGELRPMKAEDRITRRLSVNYRPDATAPRWEQFLREVLIDDDGNTAEDVVEYVQAMTGYGLTGHTSEQFFAILTGTGANGKSVYLNVLGEVFGEVAQRTPFATFEQKSSGGIPNDLAALKGARFVMASESDVNAKMSESLLKAVTGEDVITARFMRAEWFSYRPAFLLLLATNHLPRFLGQDNGLWRRVRLIEWKRELALHEQDRGLAQRIAAEEAEGVLAWAVEGAKQWYAAGRRLPESPTINAASQGYKEDSDVLGAFLTANVVKTGNKRDVVFLGDLHDRFMAWQDATGEQFRPGRTTFGKLLDERWGRPPRAAFPKHWKGYRLIAEAQVRANFERAKRELTGEALPGLSLVVPEAEQAAKYAAKFPGASPRLFGDAEVGSGSV